MQANFEEKQAKGLEKLVVLVSLILLIGAGIFSIIMMSRNERLRTKATAAAEASKASEETPSADDFEYPAPVVTELYASADNQITLKWEPVEGVPFYRVIRRTGDNGAWEEMGLTDEPMYRDALSETYVKYYYGVRCVAEDKKTFISSYEIKGDIVMRPIPKLKKAVWNDKGVLFTWEAVERCDRYRIYRKAEGDDDWIKIGESEEAQFLDTTAEKGKKTYYTVRCLTKSGKTIVSGYNKEGIKAKDK